VPTIHPGEPDARIQGRTGVTIPGFAGLRLRRALRDRRNKPANLSRMGADRPDGPGGAPGAWSPSRAPEEALIDGARHGDRAAFEELVHRYADRLYAVLLRFTGSDEAAQEATQEAFLRAWRSIARFEGRSQFFTWLYRIGINEAKRRAEREPERVRHVPLGEPDAPEPPDRSATPARRAEQSDLAAALERAIMALPPDYRAPLVLRDIEGLSTQDAAEVMELGEAAFKSRLHRARLAVRKAVKDYLVEDEP
jgi:RNA polymerase sigma-70 factor (ECF subfamily)